MWLLFKECFHSQKTNPASHTGNLHTISSGRKSAEVEVQDFDNLLPDIQCVLEPAATSSRLLHVQTGRQHEAACLASDNPSLLSIAGAWRDIFPHSLSRSEAKRGKLGRRLFLQEINYGKEQVTQNLSRKDHAPTERMIDVDTATCYVSLSVLNEY